MADSIYKSMEMKKECIILAGGEGRRAGAGLPKQFHNLGGVPLLWWSVRRFHEEDPSAGISVVLHPGFFDWWDVMVRELPDADREINVRLVCGGPSRAASVRNGLVGLPDDASTFVAVHDGARPLVDTAQIRRGWEAAENHGAAIPAIKVTDSLRELLPDGGSAAVDRSRYVAVQTPQVFRADILREAYRLDDRPEFTDDASRVEACGHEIYLYEGSPENIKVTVPGDFKIAEALLG